MGHRAMGAWEDHSGRGQERGPHLGVGLGGQQRLAEVAVDRQGELEQPQVAARQEVPQEDHP